MRKVLVAAMAAGVSLAYAGTAVAASVSCVAPGGGGSVRISCGTNSDGSLSGSCSCPAGYTLIDPTTTPPKNSSSTEPSVPSQT